MSQRRDIVGRQVSLGDPTPFSSYLMDQVFLQDSISSRRHPISSAPRGRKISRPPQSPVSPEENHPPRLYFEGLKLETDTSITMTNHGDDCYFFYYSTCAKGDSCPFRHCEAAMGNETVCNLWQEGRCFRTICKFRHMEITKNRKEIPCYWEKQSAGCQKSHCAFLHEKPRYIEGILFPPDKGLSKNEEQALEETVLPPTVPLATAANPQLRGVIKTESQEPVPSPTHPPVVINPADDDEDEDDLFSEEGDDGRAGSSHRKLPKLDDSLNFGVSTLEEIRLRKALKTSMKRAGYPIQSSDTLANSGKENIQSLCRPALYEARDGQFVFEETGRSRGSVAERLGRKMPTMNEKGGGVQLKRSLAERLGRVVDEEEPVMSPQKVFKPIKERLGSTTALIALTDQAETNTESEKAPAQIRIKTLEEIKQEKAAMSKCQKDSPTIVGPESTRTNKGVKRAVSVKDDSIHCVKMFSEILPAKKTRKEAQNPSPTKEKHTVAKHPSKSQAEPNAVRPCPEATNIEEVRVKTLEEIRREKAAKIQAQQGMQAENKRSTDTKENGEKIPCLLRINELASQGSITTQNRAEVTAQTAAPETRPAKTYNVKVKTFEEIMREKRLRRQEVEEQDKTSAEASDLIPLKSKAASPLNSITSPGARVAAVTSVPVKQSSSPRACESKSKIPRNSREVSVKNSRNSTAPPPAKQSRAPPYETAEFPAAVKTMSNNKKNSPEQTRDAKVRPKLNVKPSVMKPAVQVKPGQKRRGTERSAVAAVKPLNSSCTEVEEPLQETVCQDGQVLPSSSAAVPPSPSTLLDCLDCSSSPLREELLTVPVFNESLSQETKSTFSINTSRETGELPQSPVLKTPIHPRARRQSAALSTSAVDDFEDLINEFTDDHLEDDVDPGIGEDDLLQELSEMIDS
ncbi:zinc finger CCCH domain-containing protein 11A isoform X2 [Platichthys flesus]|uniref:zinc finger CCCH domain-containing protein 11A isoform X2 n=1 Tax=Platichthys flesus TaxID=8260 RepID=UPI002DB69C38|nr:zinc finger CCCH domain-containing protein 11A isoform X2 [Platichthys flesus]